MSKLKRVMLKDLKVGDGFCIPQNTVSRDTLYGSSGTARHKVVFDKAYNPGIVVKQNIKSTVIMVSVLHDRGYGGDFIYDGDAKQFRCVDETYIMYTIHHNDTFVVETMSFNRMSLNKVPFGDHLPGRYYHEETKTA